MNAAVAPAQPTETAPKPGRPEILDEIAKIKVLGLLELGHSRRAAARLLGCAANTITRAAARDPEFFAKLADAESQADSEALKLIRQTARQERYWRAAAWVLERRNPEDYGRRDPHTFSGDQVQEKFLRFLYAILPDVRRDRREAVMEKFDDALQGVEAEHGKEVEMTLSYGLPPGLEDAPDIMPPQRPQDTSDEALYRLELACPSTEKARAEWIMGLTQRQVERLLQRAYKRHMNDDNRRWIDDLRRRLAELIELRGGNIILEQFSQKEGKKR